LIDNKSSFLFTRYMNELTSTNKIESELVEILGIKRYKMLLNEPYHWDIEIHKPDPLLNEECTWEQIFILSKGKEKLLQSSQILGLRRTDRQNDYVFSYNVGETKLLTDDDLARKIYEKDFYERTDEAVEDTIYNILQALSLDESIYDYLKEQLMTKYEGLNSDICINLNGYTSNGVIKIGEYAIKVDKISRLKKEKYFYENIDIPFKDFCCNAFDLNEHNGVGFLIMQNIDFLPNPLTKIDSIFAKETKSYINYNILLMSFFHKSTKNFTDLDFVDYYDMDGFYHHYTSDDPGINHGGEGYSNFFKTSINIKEIAPIIDQYNQLLSSSNLDVIDGDWKQSNIYKGYKVDFANYGYGLYFDELAYFLTDIQIGYDFKQYLDAIRKYKSYRKDLNSNDSFSIELAGSSWLRQLVLRHSVMKKRDLLDPKKFKAREYYKYRIEETLKQGKFI